MKKYRKALSYISRHGDSNHSIPREDLNARFGRNLLADLKYYNFIEEDAEHGVFLNINGAHLLMQIRLEIAQMWATCISLSLSVLAIFVSVFF